MAVLSDNKWVSIELWDCYFKDKNIEDLFRRYIGEGDFILYGSLKKVIKNVMNAIRESYGDVTCNVVAEPRSDNYTISIVKGDYQNFNPNKDEEFLINFGIIEENSDETAAAIEADLN